MRVFIKTLKFVAILLVILVSAFFLGPKAEKIKLNQLTPKMPSNLLALETKINNSEAAISNIKPDNEARIIWYDSIPQKTAYSIVYLHGWSASQEEGDPIHTATAKRYGCNLYLPRLAGHGLKEEEPMLNLTAESLMQSALEALSIGKQLGEKVILMGTSTGGTLALQLAASDSDVAALLVYSPNIEIFDPNAKLMTGPWGLQLLKAIKGSDYHEFDTDIDLKNKYWTTKYRVEALVQLQALLDATMTKETFKNVTQPLFMGYYYKDEIHQDSVVSVPAMLKMFDELSTPVSQKQKVAFPDAGDHVMTSYISSKDLESVQEKTNNFLEEVVGIKKALTK